MALRSVLPKKFRLWLVRRTRWPMVGHVKFDNLRRLTPISRAWGGDRGLPVDRYYIERFLSDNAVDIQGRVLEVGDDIYTKKFGKNRVNISEVVHAEEGNPKAAYVADFANAPHLPDNTFDCIICTQTLQLIPDLQSALHTLHRILKPGGILLVTVPGISKIYKDEKNGWLDYWRLTNSSAHWLFNKVFPESQVIVNTYGNVLTAVAFLHGLAVVELSSDELNYVDPIYQLLIAIRALKPE